MNKIFSFSNRYSYSSFVAASLLGLAIYSKPTNYAFAEATETLSTEGIVGDVDKGRRAPVLTFSTEVASDGSSATILADTQIINEDFKKYPISVEFFVNGKLFSKQFRSLELPAPLGIVVPKEMAPIPFNYSIVATTLHPNRQYVTVAQGAVTGSTSDKAFQCTTTIVSTDGSGDLVISGAANNTLDSNNALSFTLTQDADSAQVALTIPESASTTSREASGTIIVTQSSTDSGDENSTEASGTTTYNVVGTAEAAGTTVSSIDVATSDGSLTLKCESSVTTAAATTTVGDESSDLEDSNLAGVLNAPTNETTTGPTSGDEIYSTGPNGETNFVPLDKVGATVVVN